MSVQLENIYHGLMFDDVLDINSVHVDVIKGAVVRVVIGVKPG